MFNKKLKKQVSELKDSVSEMNKRVIQLEVSLEYLKGLIQGMRSYSSSSEAKAITKHKELEERLNHCVFDLIDRIEKLETKNGNETTYRIATCTAC